MSPKLDQDVETVIVIVGVLVSLAVVVYLLTLVM